MPRYTIAYAKNIMRRTIRAIIDAEPTKTEVAKIWGYFKDECAYCGRKLIKGTKDAHIDHLVSAALRGGNELSNRVLSCGPCNGNEKRDTPWGNFLRHKNPNKQLFQTRRHVILKWKKQAAGRKPGISSGLRALAAADESVLSFERKCLELRKAIHPVRAD